MRLRIPGSIVDPDVAAQALERNGGPPPARGAGVWDPDLHPRGEHGRFGDKGGAAPTGRSTVTISGRATPGASTPEEARANRQRLEAAAERVAAALPNARVELTGSTHADVAEMLADRVEAFTAEFPGAAGFLDRVEVAAMPRYGGGTAVADVRLDRDDGAWTLRLNADYAEDPQALLETCEAMADEGWHPTFRSEGVIDHELGHVLDYATRAAGTRDPMAAEAELAPTAVRAAVSGYAASIQDDRLVASMETFAEAFAARQAGGATQENHAYADMPQAVRDEVDRAMEMAR